MWVNSLLIFALLALLVVLVQGVRQRRSTHLASTERRRELAARGFEELVDLLPKAAYEIDGQGNVTAASGAALARFGRDVSDLERGLSFFELICPSDRHAAESAMQSVLRGEIGGLNRYTGVTALGKHFPILVYTVPVVREGRVVGGRGIAIDVSEESSLKERLQEAAKLRAVGTLAGGAAHDFNNLLMGIQGRASLLLGRGGLSTWQREHLSEVEDYVRRASQLSQRLVGCARAPKDVIRANDANELLRDCVGMFARTHRGLEISETLADGLPNVAVDGGQIEQVILNLLLNAAQAMPAETGVVDVSTALVEMNAEAAERLDIPPALYLQVSVRDNGTGMDAATAERVFEPFFTTKEKGLGAGIGLASALSIVRRHGGAIRVKTAPGEGSTFDVLLPTTTQPMSADSARAEPLRTGDETILVVDDEPFILEVAAGLLRELGYAVKVASSGAAAVDTIAECAESIDLIILDLVMPQMSGPETLDRLWQVAPTAKVLLSSGYSADNDAGLIHDLRCAGFLQKPYSLADLSAKVRAALSPTGPFRGPPPRT